MPVLLIALALGVFAYLWWRWSRTTLTRNCRWRQDRDAGLWRCTYCGAVAAGGGAPRDCLDPAQQ